MESNADDILIPALALPPVRGLTPLHNRRGAWFSPADVHRAIRYQCHAFGVLKLDLLCNGSPPPGLLESALAFAREFQVALSLRTDGASEPAGLLAWRAAGLMDVCLAGAWDAAPERWLAACRDGGIPVRIECPAATAAVASPVRLVTTLGPAAPNVPRGIAAAWHSCPRPERVVSLEDEPVASYFEDIQQYQRDAYLHGVYCFSLSPRALAMHLVFANLRLSGVGVPSDKWVVHFLRLFTPLFPAAQTVARVARRAIPPSQPVYADNVDRARVADTLPLQHLAHEAQRWLASPTSHTLDSAEWGFENAFLDPMQGVNQLHVLLPGERRSTPLPYLRLPFMVSVTFGGGLADAIGFACGRPIRIACGMVDTAHELTLYADAAGQYVLLRDGRLVSPLLLSRRGYLPQRLPDGLHLQLAVWSPEAALSITGVRVWEGSPPAPELSGAQTSIVIFCTRFSRRLQAVLGSLAHQRGLSPGALQVIVGYVPGMDAVEDVLDSARAAWPQLQVEGVALAEHCAHSKGFGINECLARVSAPLTVLLDSDIVLSPDFLQMAIAASASHDHLAPAGRAMLDANATARILLGETKPWMEFDALAAGAAEFRIEENPQQVPLGYCQIYRTEAAGPIRYAEYDHFQGADFEFGQALCNKLGPPHRLPLPVLHLDHGTRQWFGAQKHF